MAINTTDVGVDKGTIGVSQMDVWYVLVMVAAALGATGVVLAVTMVGLLLRRPKSTGKVKPRANVKPCPHVVTVTDKGVLEWDDTCLEESFPV